MVFIINMRFSILMLFLMFSSIYGGPSPVHEDCNPLACLYEYNSFFVREDTDPCKKFGSLNSCISPCLKLSSLDGEIVSSNLKHVAAYICDGDLWKSVDQMDLSRDICPSKKKFQFLSCLYEAWNIDHIVPSSDGNILTCKKLMSADNCSELMKSCGVASQEFVEGLLLKFTETLKAENCDGYSMGEVWSHGTKSLLANQQGYSRMSKCFDMHQKEIMSCVPEKWTANFIVTQHKKKEMCRAYQSFLECTKRVLLHRCDKVVPELFVELAAEVYEQFLPHCAVAVSTAGSVPSSEVYPMQHAQNDDYVHSTIASTALYSSKDLAKEITEAEEDVKALKTTDGYVNSSNPVSEIIIIHFGPLTLDGVSAVGGSGLTLFGVLLCTALSMFSFTL